METTANNANARERGRQILRFALLLLLAVLSGMTQGACWYFPGWWIGAWLGQCGLVFLAFYCRPRWAACLGFLAGCITNGWGFSWAPQSLELCFGVSWFGGTAIFAALALWESVEFAIFCGVASVLIRRGPCGFYFVPLTWVAIEYSWPKVFPWLVGYSQLELLPLVQVAEITGPWGVSFLVTTVASLPVTVLAWKANVAHPRRTRHRLVYAISVVTILVSAITFGTLRMRHIEHLTTQGRKLRVGVVQTDPTVVGADKKLRERTLEIQDRVDLVCWPESAIGTYQNELTEFVNPDFTRAMSRNSLDMLRPTHGFCCDVLAGGKTFRQGVPVEGPYAMTAFLVNRDEKIIDRYHKRTLLPFGEYIPGQDWFPNLRKWATLNEILEAGQDARPMVSSHGSRLGVVICYEDILPANVRETAKQGAEVLISIINATAFENPLTLEQHKRLAILRAVENRRFFVRCSSTGVTCVIAPTGAILASLENGIDATLEVEVARLEVSTIYTRFGDWFPWACVFGLILYLCSSRLPAIGGWERKAEMAKTTPFLGR